MKNKKNGNPIYREILLKTIDSKNQKEDSSKELDKAIDSLEVKKAKKNIKKH